MNVVIEGKNTCLWSCVKRLIYREPNSSDRDCLDRFGGERVLSVEKSPDLHESESERGFTAG